MNILYVFADRPEEWNSSEWRCAVPTRGFEEAGFKYGHKAQMIDSGSWAIGQREASLISTWADVIVLQRLMLGPTLIAIEYWKARGKTIIGDVDDAYDLMPKTVATYPYWREGIYHHGNQIMKTPVPPYIQQKWGGKLCHAISGPSRTLMNDWSKIVDTTLYIPNYVDTRMYTLKPKPLDPERIVIGWGGGASHYDSFRLSGIVEALVQLLLKRPNVVLCLAGGVGKIASMLKRKAPLDRVLVRSWTSFDKWPAVLRDFDIGLIPLAGGYDHRRSPIKALEYALMGTPWVGSKAPIYEEFAPFGVQVSNVKSAWYEALKAMVDNYPEFKAKQHEARELAETWDIRDNLPNIVSSYEIASQKSRLERRVTTEELATENFSQSLENSQDERYGTEPV